MTQRERQILQWIEADPMIRRKPLRNARASPAPLSQSISPT